MANVSVGISLCVGVFADRFSSGWLEEKLGKLFFNFSPLSYSVPLV